MKRGPWRLGAAAIVLAGAIAWFLLAGV